jgi:hypothetical protein
VGQNTDGRLEVFVVGTEGNIWHSWQETPNGGWSPWGRLGNADDKGNELAAGRNADGRLEVFAIGTEKGIWHSWQ